MKRCLKFIGIFIIAIVFANSVSASSVTIGQIKEEWKNDIEKYDYSIKVPDTSDEYLVLMSSKEGETSSNYTVQFNFKNDVLSLAAKNVDDMDDTDKVQVSYFENLNTLRTLDIIYRLFDVDSSRLDNSKLNDYGIILETSKFEYSIGAANTVYESGTAEKITSFSIDLNKFEESTKDLVGTYNDDNDNNDTSNTVTDDIIGTKKISLSLGNAYSDKLDLIVSVGDVSDKNTNKCNIWLVDKDGVESLVTAIDNCVEGENTVTVSNLVPDTEYSYKVELIETNSLNLSNTVYSDVTKFSTISVDNPKTGGSYIYLVFGCLFISIFTFIILFTCNDRKVKSM